MRTMHRSRKHRKRRRRARHRALCRLADRLEEIAAILLTLASGRCDYTERFCRLWEPGEPGQCLAVDPEQCPANDAEDIATIEDWRRQVQPCK